MGYTKSVAARVTPRSEGREVLVMEGLFQPTHLIIILIIVLVLFGPGKLTGLGGALGKGIKEFKEAIKPDSGAVSSASTDKKVEEHKS